MSRRGAGAGQRPPAGGWLLGEIRRLRRAMLAAGMHPDDVDCVAAVALYVDVAGKAEPSLRTVAADTGRHTKRVADAVAIAEELGFVAVRRRTKSTSTYLFGFQPPRFTVVEVHNAPPPGRWLAGSGWMTG